MRFVERGVAAPAFLSSTEVLSASQSLLDFALAVGTSTSQRRVPSTQRFLGQSDLRHALTLEFDGLCAYCETPIGRVGDMQIDHFRPRTLAADSRGRTDQAYYVWLALEWRNLFPACKSCNVLKANIFPVRDRRGELGAGIEALRDQEVPLFIDPTFDEPSDHIKFDLLGYANPQDDRGKFTIAVLQLNQPALVDARRHAVKQSLDLMRRKDSGVPIKRTGARSPLSESIIDIPHGGSSTSAILDAAARLLGARELSLDDLGYRLRSMADPVGFLSSLLDPIPLTMIGTWGADQPDLAKSQLPISYVSIRNYKALKHLDFLLPENGDEGDSASCMIILGENATGKSSVLEAITLGLLGVRQIEVLRERTTEARLRPSEVMHRDIDGATSKELIEIEIGFTASDNRTSLRALSHDTRFAEQGHAGRCVLAYGPRRFFSRRPTRRFREQANRVISLFDPLATIPNPERWLSKCSPTQFNAAARALREVLMLSDEDELYRDAGGVQVRTAAGVARLDDLSAGYKSVVGMVVDIIRELLARYDNIEYANATVLIDELETHLHPRWKIRILGSLRRAFPRVQFIVTTHDPLCLRGAEDGEVFVLRRDSNRDVYSLQDLPSTHGMRAEQLLTSEFFGLGTTDPESEAKLVAYQRLAQSRLPLDSQQSAEMSRLQDELQGLLVVGSTISEQAFVEAMKVVEAETRPPADRPNQANRLEVYDRALERLRAATEAAPTVVSVKPSSTDSAGSTS